MLAAGCVILKTCVLCFIVILRGCDVGSIVIYYLINLTNEVGKSFLHVPVGIWSFKKYEQTTTVDRMAVRSIENLRITFVLEPPLSTEISNCNMLGREWLGNCGR